MDHLTKEDLELAAIAGTLALALNGCRAIDGIFEAGVWMGVIIVGFLLLIGFGAARVLARR